MNGKMLFLSSCHRVHQVCVIGVSFAIVMAGASCSRTTMPGRQIKTADDQNQDSTIQVVVGGEVRIPGTYALKANATVSDAIEAAGGLSDYYSLYFSEVRRAKEGKVVRFRDLPREEYDRIPLMEGDYVYISHRL